MNPGKLKHLLSVMTVNSTRNEFGEVEEGTPTLAFNAWAELLNDDHKEQYIADGEAIVANKVFRVRYNPLLTTKNLVNYNGVSYNIINVDNEREESRYMILSLVNYEL